MLSSLQQSILLTVEQDYNDNGVPTTIPALAERFDLAEATIEEEFEQPALKEALARKYLLGYYNGEKAARQTLSEDQFLIIDMLTDPNDKRTNLQKLRAIRRTPAWLQAQMKDPVFCTEINKRGERTFRERAWEVFNSIATTAANGDMKAAGMYMEMIGKYSPRTSHVHSGTVNVEMGTTVQLLVEVIQRHCTPEQIEKISRDFNVVMKGEELPQHKLNALPVAAVALPVERGIVPEMTQANGGSPLDRIKISEKDKEILRPLFEGFDDTDAEI